MKEEKQQEFVLGAATGFFLGMAVLIAFCFSVLTTMCLWNWFVHPLGLVKLGFFHSLGLMIFLTYINKEKIMYMKIKLDEDENLSFVLGSFIIMTSCLVFGFFIHLFV